MTAKDSPNLHSSSFETANAADQPSDKSANPPSSPPGPDAEQAVKDSYYDDLPPKLRAEFEELDTYATHWIGTDLRRWTWYEQMKARRVQLEATVKSQREEMDGSLGELREALRDLERLFGTDQSLVEGPSKDAEQGRITPTGWSVALGIAFGSVAVNCLLVYAIYVMGSNLAGAVGDVWNPSPF